MPRASALAAHQETLLDVPGTHVAMTHTCEPAPRSDFEKGDAELQK